MNDVSRYPGESSTTPVVIPVEAYTSQEYARAEAEKLWGKVWQVACRVEELPKVGDYVTYDILDESIIVVRTAKDRIQAFYNVCLHRGRRLTEGCGHTAQFYCRFHGWRWDLNGENAFVLDREDWGASFTPENLRMKQVQVDTWGGWVWINMDPDCEPLLDYLKPASPLLEPFELERMRFRWRQWLYFPCNWKTAIEAFNESYHLDATHPQRTKWGTTKNWSKAGGKHTWHGMGQPRGGAARTEGGLAGAVRTQAGQDPRVVAAEQIISIYETVNATTTQTFVEVAAKLTEELPPEATPAEVGMHLMKRAKGIDEARGVAWPDLPPGYMGQVGHDWHLFPNTVILPSLTTALCYRARPNGDDPNSCIFEVYVLERFPEGQEPKTEWVYEPDPTEEKWRLILSQDFQNMPKVQQGMKSRGFPGPRPSPEQELAIIHFHKMLAEYMGTGAPEPF
ncbi:aromatic ring-hydroxylating dioxygenase subunit alpha [Phenylobacterium sp. LjRoot219]|uniref:aromatic ring-hydroxylating oxygenase subunit alpha n=1 Tax=Phenylobacterium sp. LjRoot219 TaxID=3342283 RepID=UPI003ECCCDFE